MIKQAQLSQSMSESVVHILRRLHTIILVSQGRKTLERCRHPSADPIDLRTPPDLRPSIRSIVNMLEESLACFSGGSDTSVGSPTPALPRPQTGFSSFRGTSRWESTSSRLSASQYQSQSTHKEWDVMDEGYVLSETLPSIDQLTQCRRDFFPLTERKMTLRVTALPTVCYKKVLHYGVSA